MILKMTMNNNNFYAFADDGTLTQLNQQKIQELEGASEVFYSVVSQKPTSKQTVEVNIIVMNNTQLNALVNFLQNQKNQNIVISTEIGIGNSVTFRYLNFDIVEVSRFESARFSDELQNLLNPDDDDTGVLLKIKLEGFVV